MLHGPARFIAFGQPQPVAEPDADSHQHAVVVTERLAHWRPAASIAVHVPARPAAGCGSAVGRGTHPVAYGRHDAHSDSDSDATPKLVPAPVHRRLTSRPLTPTTAPAQHQRRGDHSRGRSPQHVRAKPGRHRASTSKLGEFGRGDPALWTDDEHDIASHWERDSRQRVR